MDIYDTNWTLLDRIQVTQTQRPFNAQRPWVQVTGNRMFVSYDVPAMRRVCWIFNVW